MGPNPGQVTEVDAYLLALALASDGIVQAANAAEPDPDGVQAAIDAALSIQAPEGMHAWTALVTVLAAQVIPNLRPDLRLLWVSTMGDRLAEDETRWAS